MSAYGFEFEQQMELLEHLFVDNLTFIQYTEGLAREFSRRLGLM